MYMMFVYADGKAMNSMGIRDNDVLNLMEQAKIMISTIYQKTPAAEVEIKIVPYI